MPSLAAPAIPKILGDHGLTLARVMLLGVLVSMLVSTSLAIGFEFASYLVFACLPELRSRLGGILRHPLMAGFLPFAAVIAFATLYGPVSWHDAASALIGWRRLLLLPLCLAVFDDEPIEAAGAQGADRDLRARRDRVFHRHLGRAAECSRVRNRVPQLRHAGHDFSLAIAAARRRCCARRPSPAIGCWRPPHHGGRVIALLAVDIVVRPPGRSGYVIVIIMAVVLVVSAWRRAVAREGVGRPRRAGLRRRWCSSRASMCASVSRRRSRDRDRGPGHRRHLAGATRRHVAHHGTDDPRPSGLRGRHRRVPGRLPSLCSGRGRLAGRSKPAIRTTSFSRSKASRGSSVCWLSCSSSSAS